MSDKKEVSLERGWAIILRDLGVQPENVLRRAQLPGDLLTRENVRVTVKDYFGLWNAVEAESADPTLPIRFAESISPEAFQPPIFAALCSPDLTVAVRRIARYKRLVAPMSMIIEKSTEGLFVGCQWDDPCVQAPASLAATELTYLTQIARIATREPIRPVRVASPHPMEPKEAYEAFFGVAPTQAEKHGVTFSAADARRPFLTANETLWQTFEPELQRRITKVEASAPLAERVRSNLLEGLPSGEASVGDTARRLGLSPRTLQRNLKLEGTSYKEIVRQTREQLARYYVTNTNLTYVEIGFLVGYEEPSSFFRAFREWTGETPESVRLAASG
jgi:AraC-like DNA-binding protein